MSEVLQWARREAGLTQDELAVSAETSQSAIAAYETGAREPSWSVLERIVRASGHLLALEIRPDPAVFRLVDLAAELADTADEAIRLRLVFEFIRGAAAVDQPVRLLVAADLPSARAAALVHTPASYRRRGIMIDRHDLEAA